MTNKHIEAYLSKKEKLEIELNKFENRVSLLEQALENLDLPKPEVGQRIYLDMEYIRHNISYSGGLCVISSIEPSRDHQTKEIKDYKIRVFERKGFEYNYWRVILNKQFSLKKKFKSKRDKLVTTDCAYLDEWRG